MQDDWCGTHNAGMCRGQSGMISGNAGGTSLLRLGRSRSKFLALERGLIGNTGETNYHISQFLTTRGGCYMQYLCKFRLDDSPIFPVQVAHGRIQNL